MRVLVVDNYDSFTYNLVQVIGVLGARPDVVRNDRFAVADVVADPPDAILLGPGPGTPDDAGYSLELLQAVAGRVPVLGVCLGHQCIGQAYGGRIGSAPSLLHGKTSAIYHRRDGIYADLPVPFDATRYHSLVVERSSLPTVLRVTAETSDGLVMGLRHREDEVEGVQFHPESVLTRSGPALLRNWLQRLRDGGVGDDPA